MRLDAWGRAEGVLTPLGATWIESAKAYNFALYSKNATAVSLLVYGDGDFVNPIRTFAFGFPAHKTARIWHMLVPASEIAGARYYAYKIDGPFGPGLGERFDRGKLLLDPFAKGIFLPSAFSREAARGPGPNDGKAPLGILPPGASAGFIHLDDPPTRHTHDLIICELHVRNFTKHPSAGLDDRTRGTYAGVAAMVPYLKDLGVTAVELLPVHQYDPQEGSQWGYVTLGFFSPHHAYARNSNAEAAVEEFRAMVDALHAADIEVILDVVYNHTTEGDQNGDQRRRNTGQSAAYRRALSGRVGGGRLRPGPGVSRFDLAPMEREVSRRCQTIVKGDKGLVSSLMTRLYGSTDLFPDDLPSAFRPHQSINFITCHDGLSLYDTVSYTNDGQASCNCGWEGDASVPPAVAALRKQQIKNFCCVLMLANGAPMFVAGDEFMNTRCGNDNPYDQDGEIVWLDWRRLDANPDIFRFFKTMIAFRKAHPSIGRSNFWEDDVRWHGVSTDPDESYSSHTLAILLRGGRFNDSDLYVMINC